MYRNNDKKQNITHVNYVFDDLGMGDAIAALPALKYVYDFHQHVIMHLWIPDFFIQIVERSLPVDKKRVIIRPLSLFHKKWNKEYLTRSFKIFNGIQLATHPVDVAFFNFLNRQIDNSHKNYLSFDVSDQDITKFNLPKDYAIITVCYTTDVRQMLPEYINQIAVFLNEKGITPVFLGQEASYNGIDHVIKGKVAEEIDFTKGINLVNRTTLLESKAIIEKAKCVVGLDNGLIHLAGTCNDVPIVVGYTTADPLTRMPYRSGVLGHNVYAVVPPNLDCRFCQTQMNLTLRHNFVNCFYGDKQCVYDLKANLYIEKLKEILK